MAGTLTPPNRASSTYTMREPRATKVSFLTEQCYCSSEAAKLATVHDSLPRLQTLAHTTARSCGSDWRKCLDKQPGPSFSRVTPCHVKHIAGPMTILDS
jgi:hypothetical protein